MTTSRKVLASLGALLAACLLHAADSKPIARVIAIQEVITDDPTGYNVWVGKANEIVKAKLGIDQYIRVFQSNFDGEKTNTIRTVTAAESVAAMTKNAAAIENDPALIELRDHYRQIRKLGARVLYQAVRFDGTPKNGSVFSTTANITDEVSTWPRCKQGRRCKCAVALCFLPRTLRAPIGLHVGRANVLATPCARGHIHRWFRLPAACVSSSGFRSCLARFSRPGLCVPRRKPG